jgi:hypothetical protein
VKFSQKLFPNQLAQGVGLGWVDSARRFAAALIDGRCIRKLLKCRSFTFSLALDITNKSRQLLADG